MRYDHFSMLPEKAFKVRGPSWSKPATLEGGGGGPPAQPTETVQTTIPEYAQPYMERLLGKTEALTESPYQIYEGQRLSAPSAQQEDARREAAGLSAPGQFGVGTGLIGAGGLQSLGAGQYQTGQFTTPMTQAQQLQQFQAQGPAGVQSGLGSFTGQGTAQQFMSPYMQQVVDAQKKSALREAQMAQMQANLAAPRQGTYGGARQALGQAERERGLLDRLNQIQSSGSQAAFEQAQKAFEQEQARGLQAGIQTQQLGTQTGLENLRAILGVQDLGARQDLESQRANQQAMMEAQKMREQSRQFGGELGLRGAGQAAQAGQALGQIGTAQQGADLERIKAQELFGGLQQQSQQAALDLAYQDFLAQQQYPYKQLGFMSDLLRGSANLAGTGGKTVYETPPSMLQQAVGPGLLGLGLYREFMK